MWLSRQLASRRRGAMGAAWNFMSFESKDNLLEAIRRESAGMFELAADAEVWMAPTGAGHWQVRDVVGDLLHTHETHFVGFAAPPGALLLGWRRRPRRRRPAAAGAARRHGRPRRPRRAGAPLAGPRGRAGAAARGARQDAGHRGGPHRGGLEPPGAAQVHGAAPGVLL